MNYKWIGAVLIISGCGAGGFAMAAAYRREERLLRQLAGVLDYMTCELRYRLTSLPQLCRQAAEESTGCIAGILHRLADALDTRQLPDVESCIRSAVNETGDLPGSVREAFELLGGSLGRFDLEGQLQGLEAVRSHCRHQLEELSAGREARLRSYQTLGLCTGAALAILLI